MFGPRDLARRPGLGVDWGSRDGIFWLYNDSPDSRVDYFERLGRLMSQKMRLVAKVIGRDHGAPHAVVIPSRVGRSRSRAASLAGSSS